MGMPAPHVLGLVALLGSGGSGQTLDCTYSFVNSQTHATGTEHAYISVDSAAGTVAYDNAPGQVDTTTTQCITGQGQCGGAQGSVSNPCPTSLVSGFTTFNFVSTIYKDGQSSGIFEWNLPTTLCGLTAVAIAMWFGAILWMKRAINVITEETSEDDNLTWHEDENGKVFFRVKRRNAQDW